MATGFWRAKVPVPVPLMSTTTWLGTGTSRPLELWCPPTSKVRENRGAVFNERNKQSNLSAESERASTPSSRQNFLNYFSRGLTAPV